jgi:hypothetical protein
MITRLRQLIILGVLVAMPVLAVPVVNRRVNDFLRPPGPQLATRDKAASGTAVVRSPVAELRRAEGVADALRRLGAHEFEFFAGPTPPSDHSQVGEQIQFRCRVAVPGSAVYSRDFRGTGDTDEAAMADALSQIRSWQRAARQF